MVCENRAILEEDRMVEQSIYQDLEESNIQLGFQELNEFYYGLFGISDCSAQVSDGQPKPKLPLLSRGSDPTLAKRFEDELNGT